MADVVRSLSTYVDRDRTAATVLPSTAERLGDLSATWNEDTKELGKTGQIISPHLETVVLQKVDELKVMIRALTRSVVDLSDTRENIILALIRLFEQLNEGDRFLSITSPHLWQGGALGLDGRYFTATALAA